MKLAIYQITVNCPDTFEDKDWPEYSQDLLDAVFDAAEEPMTEVIRRIQQIDSRLTVEVSD